MTDMSQYLYGRGIANAAANAFGLGNAVPSKPLRACPHKAGSPAAILWHKLHDAKENAEYCDAMIKEYMDRKKAADIETKALQDALDKLTA